MARLRVGTGDWILIGDGKKALLLHNEGDAELLNLRRLSVRTQENPATSEQGTDRPGRSFSSVGAGRSAYETTDWHELEEARFATDIATDINAAAHQHSFKRLIVVAPPKTLGELRSAFSGEVQKMIGAEINKDLTHHTIPQIEKLLSRHEI
ncbi:MAG: host attachment family protein [Beijerinckiaceae bacterium]|jgi:protein required for attachment to host cells|nr:host attachment family protein [Beijerinckiaceae bacterium]MDO9443342.1 host attachment family protein [Beijerinckiaceae bacterium]